MPGPIVEFYPNYDTLRPLYSKLSRVEPSLSPTHFIPKLLCAHQDVWEPLSQRNVKCPNYPLQHLPRQAAVWFRHRAYEPKIYTPDWLVQGILRSTTFQKVETQFFPIDGDQDIIRALRILTILADVGFVLVDAGLEFEYLYKPKDKSFLSMAAKRARLEPAAADTTAEECVICLAPLNGAGRDVPGVVRSEYFDGPCRHAALMHIYCLYKWIQNNPSCPQCRHMFSEEVLSRIDGLLLGAKYDLVCRLCHNVPGCLASRTLSTYPYCEGGCLNFGFVRRLKGFTPVIDDDVVTDDDDDDDDERVDEFINNQRIIEISSDDDE